jgi:NADP-dependent 3-hydroxy acid dehydrogenase YdfG
MCWSQRRRSVFRSVADMSVDEWHSCHRHEPDGGLLLLPRGALPHLVRAGDGWIINISSLASKNPFVNAAAYSASKAALNAFSEALDAGGPLRRDPGGVRAADR